METQQPPTQPIQRFTLTLTVGRPGALRTKELQFRDGRALFDYINYRKAIAAVTRNDEAMLATLVADFLHLTPSSQTIAALADYVLALDQNVLSTHLDDAIKQDGETGLLSADHQSRIWAEITRRTLHLLGDPNLDQDDDAGKDGPTFVRDDFRNEIRLAILSRLPTKYRRPNDPETASDAEIVAAPQYVLIGPTVPSDRFQDLKANGFSIPRTDSHRPAIIGYQTAPTDLLALPPLVWDRIIERLEERGPDRTAHLLRAYLDGKLGREPHKDKKFFYDQLKNESSSLSRAIRHMRAHLERYTPAGEFRSRHRRRRWALRPAATVVRDGPIRWTHNFDIGFEAEGCDKGLDEYGRLQYSAPDREQQILAAKRSHEAHDPRQNEDHVESSRPNI